MSSAAAINDFEIIKKLGKQFPSPSPSSIPI